MKPLIVVLLSGLVLGCPGCSRLYGNIYEGVRVQKRLEARPGIDDPDRTGQTPAYDEYLRQRQEATGNHSTKPAAAAPPVNP